MTDLASTTPNVVVQNPRVRKVANVVIGSALIILPSATVLDSTSPDLDFAQWLVPAMAVTSFLAGMFGLTVTTPNVPVAPPGSRRALRATRGGDL